MKYGAQSADVINEARAFERQLDWVLFQREQEVVLYGDGEDPDAWTPGVPLFTDPRYTFALPSHSDYRGNHVRPMVELFENDETFESDREMRCQPCGVDWKGKDVCFVCYEDRPDPYSQSRQTWTHDFPFLYANGRRAIGQVNRVEEDEDGLTVRAHLNPDEDALVFSDMLDDFDIDANRVRYMMEARMGPVLLASTREYLGHDEFRSANDSQQLVDELRDRMQQELSQHIRDYMEFGLDTDRREQ